MVPIHARQPCRQRAALGVLLLAVFWLRRQRGLQRCELLFDGGDVAVHRFFEQRALLGAELLALGAVLQPLELRDLEGELVDLGVAPADLVGVATAALEQLAHQLTQLIDAQLVELVGIDLRHVEHVRQCRRRRATRTIGISSNCSPR